MRPPTGQTLNNGIGALAILAVSFFATLKILDYVNPPEDPHAKVIHVAEATYGSNCNGSTAASGQVYRVSRHNATAAVAHACDDKAGSCSFTIDVSQLGDPAGGCGKDFTLRWQCGTDVAVHQIYMPSEANGKNAVISCPAH